MYKKFLSKPDNYFRRIKYFLEFQVGLNVASFYIFLCIHSRPSTIFRILFLQLKHIVLHFKVVLSEIFNLKLDLLYP